MVTVGSKAFSTLVNEVLVVEACGPDQFVGMRPLESFDRIYGGEVVAQTLIAAAAAAWIPSRQAHSLHVSFLGIGDPAEAVVYAVQRLRDSSHFSTRLVIARQRDRPIATGVASFQVPREGFEHAAAPAPGNPPSRNHCRPAAPGSPRCSGTTCRRMQAFPGPSTSATSTTSPGRRPRNRRVPQRSRV